MLLCAANHKIGRDRAPNACLSSAGDMAGSLSVTTLHQGWQCCSEHASLVCIGGVCRLCRAGDSTELALGIL